MKYKKYITQNDIAKVLNYSNLKSFSNSSKHKIILDYTDYIISLVEDNVVDVSKFTDVQYLLNLGNDINHYIYFLFFNNTLVYIGQTNNILNRINSHKRDKLFTDFTYYPTNKKIAISLEKDLISFHSPIYNRLPEGFVNINNIEIYRDNNSYVITNGLNIFRFNKKLHFRFSNKFYKEIHFYSKNLIIEDVENKILRRYPNSYLKYDRNVVINNQEVNPSSDITSVFENTDNYVIMNKENLLEWKKSLKK